MAIEIDHFAALRIARPARGLVLVHIPDGVPWQVAMLLALRGQATTWGGSANIVVPWTDDLIDRYEFLALARALDPDCVISATLSEEDVAGCLGTVEPDERAAVRRTTMPLPRPDAKAIANAIALRLPVLQRKNSSVMVNVAPTKGGGFPFVPVSELDQLPSVGIPRFSTDLDLSLLLAAEYGDITDEAVQHLARQAVVADPQELPSAADAVERVFSTPTPGATGAWRLAEVGLRWVWPATRSMRCTLVVGDDPWDFSAAYALRRHTGLAWWLPTRYARDLEVQAWLGARMAPYMDELETVEVLSTSDLQAAQELAEAMALQSPGEPHWSASDSVAAALAAAPNRLVERLGGLESLGVNARRTGYLLPQVPDVQPRPGAGLYWMAEVMGDNWQPLPDPRIVTSIVEAPNYNERQARLTRNGVAYISPHFIRLGGDDPAHSAVRPRLKLLDLGEQLQGVLDHDGWRIEPSDKGRYSDASARLLGGQAELLEAMSNGSWISFFEATRSPQAPDGSSRGWDLKDQRVYMPFAELQAAIGEAVLPLTVNELLAKGVVLRGLVFGCPICKAKGWYGADELAGQLRCSRCREPFSLTQPGWQPPEEPQWRYRLAEVIWQLMEHNGDLPIRAVHSLLGITLRQERGYTAVLAEQDLWPPDEDRPIELDICAQTGPELWIGEAKIASTMGNASAERGKLKALGRAAEVLRPHGILLATGEADGWSERTSRVALEILGAGPWMLVLASAPRPSP